MSSHTAPEIGARDSRRSRRLGGPRRTRRAPGGVESTEFPIDAWQAGSRLWQAAGRHPAHSTQEQFGGAFSSAQAAEKWEEVVSASDGEAEGASVTGLAPAAIRRAHHTLVVRAKDVGLTVEPLRARFDIGLRSAADDESTRRAAARLVWRVLGEIALSDEVELTLNGTSLTVEVVEEALAPTVVYTV